MINRDLLEQLGVLGYNDIDNIDKVKRMLKKYASSVNTSINIYEYFEGVRKVWSVPDLCTVKGLDAPFYKKLNGTNMKLLFTGTDYCKVESKVNLKLPYKYQSSIPTCRYDGVNTYKTGEKTFLYTVPKANVLRKNLCALAISKGIKPKKYSFLCKVLCVDGDYVYLHLITFSKRVEYSKKIIGLYQSLAEGQARINEILTFFINNGIILNDYVEYEEGEPFNKYEELSPNKDIISDGSEIVWL